ncbi:MAG: SBBP repeat-containing protein, partial [Ignavibacteria bacterium]|nr:SBBP repeat-containing protein [Ignavibacteria bacterium]
MKTKYKIVVYITGIYLLCSNLYAQYNPEWVARYNGPGNGNDYANCIALDKNGNIYVSGENVGIGTGNDIVTIKYNSSGNAIWTQTYNSGVNSRDAAYSIAVTNNNIYITGTINN